MSTLPPPNWYPDPSGRHQFRYWDGSHWTDWAADGGVQITDPLNPTSTFSNSTQNAVTLNARLPQTSNEYRLVGSEGHPDTEVAGEFARMDAIHRAIGRKPKGDEQIVVEDLTAELRPEPRNRYDSNAVMVIINGEHVGYLAKDVAAVYQPLLLLVSAAGYVPVTGARIWANARPDWDNPRKTRYGANVRVALNAPHLLLPVNNPPAVPHSLLPWGNGLQVTGEENHQEVLVPLLGEHGEAIALGTLATMQSTSSKSTRTLVEVRINEHRIGQLTPASSQHFIPTIEHLAARGMHAAVWVRVKGSQIAAQATLQATKAHELSAAWFSRTVTVPRLQKR